jgi:hypothetical protein
VVGGAWPFLVGGLICLVNSENERDLNLLNSCIKIEYISNIFSLFGKIFLFSLSFWSRGILFWQQGKVFLDFIKLGEKEKKLTS